MEKPAETQFPVHDLIKKRWSPRAFSDRMVAPQAVLTLLESARWAASSFNDQPWSFIVATKDDPAEYARLLGCLVEGNQSWARAAPVLILSMARLSFSGNQKPNRHAYHDVGLAVGNFLVQATALGLSVHQMPESRCIRLHRPRSGRWTHARRRYPGRHLSLFCILLLSNISRRAWDCIFCRSPGRNAGHHRNIAQTGPYPPRRGMGRPNASGIGPRSGPNERWDIRERVSGRDRGHRCCHIGMAGTDQG